MRRWSAEQQSVATVPEKAECLCSWGPLA